MKCVCLRKIFFPITDVHIYAYTYNFLLLVCSNDIGFASFRLFANIHQTVQLFVNLSILFAVMDQAIRKDVWLSTVD